jgi:hypothetical protein
LIFFSSELLKLFIARLTSTLAPGRSWCRVGKNFLLELRMS